MKETYSKVCLLKIFLQKIIVKRMNKQICTEGKYLEFPYPSIMKMSPCTMIGIPSPQCKNSGRLAKITK